MIDECFENDAVLASQKNRYGREFPVHPGIEHPRDEVNLRSGLVLCAGVSG